MNVLSETSAWSRCRHDYDMALPKQEGEGEGEEQDPGAAVALGAALLVRLLVPAWVVNATLLPISAIVLPRVKPHPKAAPPQVCPNG